MKWFIATLFIMMASPVWACNLTHTNLPESVRKELEAKCLQAEAAMHKQDVKTEAEKLSVYADVAMQVAKAIGVAARELGVEVNKFIATPAGMLTVAVILATIFGKMLAVIVVAIIINIVTWRVLYRMWFVATDRTIEVSHFLFFKKTVPVYEMTTYHRASDGQVFLTVILILVSLIPIVMIPAVSWSWSG